MNKPRYLIITREHPLNVRGINSGAEMATLFLARTLASRGERVTVAAVLKEPVTDDRGVEFWDLGPTYDVAGALDRANADGEYFLLSAGRALPILLSERDPFCLRRILITHDRSGADSGLTIRTLLPHLDRVLCVSHAQRTVLIDAGADGSKLEVVHNGSDYDLFTPGDPAARDPNSLVFVGALIPDKGIHWLIQSFAELKGSFPKLSLDVFGSAALWGRESFINEKELAAKLPGLRFHGAVEQPRIAEALRRAALCVIPSIWFDPFPLVSLDAQACGCPVAAFDMGGLAEGIVDGESGFVIREISQEGLTRSLASILADRDTLRDVATRAASSVRERFSWAKVADTVMQSCCRSGTEQAVPAKRSEVSRGTIGFLTTWNQHCGLATYARYLTNSFAPGSYVVLAEDGIPDSARTAPDESWVQRCWSRASDDYRSLERAIEQARVGLLHINCHYRFFHQPSFRQTLERLRTRGVKVVVHLHQVFTTDDRLRALLRAADAVLVHNRESVVEAIANGAPPAATFHLPHGVDIQVPPSAAERAAIRTRLGIKPEEKAIVSFGFLQPHKGMEGVLEAVHHLRTRNIPARGFICGSVMKEDSGSAAYAESLVRAARELGIDDAITFEMRYLSDAEVTTYLHASDLVLINYRSQHFEASGVCSLAVGAGAVVGTSLAPPFVAFEDAVWHITSGYPITLSSELLLSDESLRSALQARAQTYAQRHAWPRIGALVRSFYRKIGFSPQISMKEKIVDTTKRPIDSSTSRGTASLRVLMQNRPNALTQRGGDTVVMERTADGLRTRGIDVVIDLEGRIDPSGFDLVHLFNFALPDLTRRFAERAATAGVPFVVTTLSEDVGAFHFRSHAVANSLMEYVIRNQDKSWFDEQRSRWSAIHPAARFDNSWTANNAAALLANGQGEAAVIKREYPSTGAIEIVPVGYEVAPAADPGMFISTYGVRDFILCVGRFESRKNQLMLLKALEQSELPVVLASGGFAYQPDYDRAVRSFQRRGQTIIVDRLTPEMLASAYAACRIHVLPSWYELPGLVSLEAAAYGKNVVAVASGTTRDYLGDDGFYCLPDDEQSIFNAVMAAYYSPVRPGLASRVRAYTWSASVDATVRVYQRVAKVRTKVEEVAVPSSARSEPAMDLESLLRESEEAALQGNFFRAHELVTRCETMNNRSARVYRSRGALSLAENKTEVAQGAFRRALELDRADAKAWVGLGMCEMKQERFAEAIRSFETALGIDSDLLVGIRNLIECSYRLDSYEALERCLRAFCSRHPQDIEMKFCLAGCLYKRGIFGESERMMNEVLQANANHKGALELEQLLRNRPQSPTPRPLTVERIATPPPSKGEWQNAAGVPSHSGMGEVDSTLLLLEDAKRRGEFESVIKGCESLGNRSDLAPSQREVAILLRAEALVLSGSLTEASSEFERVLAVNPQSARALCGKAALKAHHGMWEEARALFEQALSCNASSDVAHAGIGLVNLQHGDTSKAWEYFERAVEINPENTRALLGLLEIGYKTRQFSGLERALKAYLEMHPADVEFLYSLAGCYFAQNKLREAEEEIQKITLFAPDHRDALELRGLIAERQSESRV